MKISSPNPLGSPVQAAPAPAIDAQVGGTSSAAKHGWTPPTRPTDIMCRLALGGSPDRRAPEAHQVVLKGDTLWTIAAEGLEDDATTRQVAREVTQWMKANPWLRTRENATGPPGGTHLRPGEYLRRPQP